MNEQKEPEYPNAKINIKTPCHWEKHIEKADSWKEK